MKLEFLNHPPVVPPGCAALGDQTQCAEPGDVVHLTNEFGAATPAGPGIEVVLDRRDCVLRTSTVRGTALARGQSSSTMVAAGTLVNHPSDAAGERSVGDALVYLDRHQTH